MNRIIIKYWNKIGKAESCLKIYNDIKGDTYEQVGTSFYGKDADIMWAYFKNAKIKENDEVMSYGLCIDGKYLHEEE